MWLTSESKYTIEDLKHIYRALIIYEEHMKDEKIRMYARELQYKISQEIKGEN